MDETRPVKGRFAIVPSMTVSFQREDIERLRQRLRKMSDEELTDFGLAAESVCRDKLLGEVS